MPQQLKSSRRYVPGMERLLAGSRDHRPVGSYVFDWRSVCLAAIASATAMTFFMMIIPRLLGVEVMDIGITIGAMADPAGGVVAFLVRVAWHVVHGVLYVPFYAAILLRFQKQSTAWTGVGFGVFLWLAGPMLLIPILLNRPLINSGDLHHPGIFMLGLGVGLLPAAIDLGAHLTHGILAGVICKHQQSDEN